MTNSDLKLYVGKRIHDFRTQNNYTNSANNDIIIAVKTL